MFRQSCIDVSSKNHQQLINGTKTLHRYFTDQHTVYNNDLQCLLRIHRSFINFASMLHGCLFNEETCFSITTSMISQNFQRVLNWSTCFSTIQLVGTIKTSLQVSVSGDKQQLFDRNLLMFHFLLF